ncbi:MAG: hypothetical protein J5630_00860 [Bacteroidaceae bacterium]|nr:hypothetical protein [Bacteroidaceae bacterium]
MDNKEHFEVYENGYREGYFIAAQQLASTVLRLINNHPSWMLDPERRAAIAEVKLATKHLLVRRGIIPSSYDVIMGKAEEVKLDFDMKT